MATNARCDVLVVGSDTASLAAALDCARIGLSVTVWIPSETRWASTPAVFTHRGGIVADYFDQWNIPYRVEKPLKGAEEICGIPGNPFSSRVVSGLGWSGAWRVYFERIKPILTIGTEANLGKLVSSRMGEKAKEKLVNPATQLLYGCDSDHLNIDDVAPGLPQAMTRAGSLQGGIIEQYAADPRVCDKVIVEGGFEAINHILLEQLEYFAATIVRPQDPSKKLTTFTQKASVFLLDFGDVIVPDSLSAEIVFEVGISTRNPGCESAIPASLQAALASRRVLLSDPKKPPIGLGGVSS